MMKNVILFMLLFTATIFSREVNLDKLDFTGDVRLRHEVVDDSTVATDVTRQRVRARLNVSANVAQDTVVGIGLATGPNDRRSTNQTLGGTFDPKDINLDTAYISTKLVFTDVTVGKFKNPLVRQSELFWDDDVRPEGGVLAYTLKGVTLRGAYLITQDNATNDEGMAVGELSYAHEYFDVAGSFTETMNNPTKARYAGVNGDVKPFGYLTPFGEYIVNLDATNNNDTAWLAGVRATVQKFKLQYAYRDVEAQAVNAMLTDSDFGNGVNAKGSEYNASYCFKNNIEVGATYFDLKNGLATSTDYDRFQLDASVKF
jgi:hypothetical protein